MRLVQPITEAQHDDQATAYARVRTPVNSTHRYLAGNALVCGDKLDILRELPDECIYLDPPFNSDYNYVLKSKFGDVIRAKTPVVQVNETLMKVLCHNIVVLGPTFATERALVA
ncbi:MAG: hypothetical protein OXL97_00660 [Chloroflexota bacterium]|nr:hypothetical protein [Chloroflexota bacterium]MDE2883654.1 hypothetical protein [Chloroflexota bacterium]